MCDRDGTHVNGKHGMGVLLEKKWVRLVKGHARRLMVAVLFNIDDIFDFLTIRVLRFLLFPSPLVFAPLPDAASYRIGGMSLTRCQLPGTEPDGYLLLKGS